MTVGQTAFVKTRGTYGAHGTIVKIGRRLVHVRYLTSTGKTTIRRVQMDKLKKCSPFEKQDWEEIDALRKY